MSYISSLKAVEFKRIEHTVVHNNGFNLKNLVSISKSFFDSDLAFIDMLLYGQLIKICKICFE